MLVFEVCSPEGSKRRCEVVDRDVTIGRDSANSIMLNDSKVSHFHAVAILRDSGELVLRDIGSANGLTVNDEPASRHVLEPGDRVTISPYTLTFLGVSEGAQAESSDVFRLPRRPASRGAGAIDDSRPSGTSGATLALQQLPTAATPQGVDWSGMTENRVLQALQSAQEVASIPSVRVMVGRLLDSVLSSLGAAKGFVLLDDGERLVWTMGRPQHQAITPLSASASAAVYGAADSRLPMLSPAAEPSSDDVLCIPLIFNDELVGVVGAEGRFQSPSPVQGLDIATALCALSAAHVANARERDRLQQQCSKLHEAVQASHRLVGGSAAFHDLLGQVHKAAQCDYPVLILGETGVGKDLAAEAIHRLSGRRDAPFIEVNCAALPETLLESEMFGYAPYSGIANADPRGKMGKFEAADDGTLFLNEIGDMSPSLQAKLLTALDKQLIVRIGSNDPVHVNVRVLAATNMDISGMVQNGKFRGDLYRRIKCLEITVPPLRKRPGDILLLAAYFLEQHVPRPLNEMLRFSKETAKLLTSYPWPMNVGELRNAILAAAIRSTSEEIEPEHFDEEISGFRTRPVVKTLSQVEKEHIWRVLRITNGNKREAARLLGISHTTLHEKVKGYGLEMTDDTRKGAKA